MRLVWNDVNGARRERIKKEPAAAQGRQAEVGAYWNRHKGTVMDRWGSRTGVRGETTVADIPEVAAQWHRDNRILPEHVSATSQRRGEVIPYLVPETCAVRAWAQRRGKAVGGSGRVPDRITAFYRLDQAGRDDLLGPDGLLDEACVREWAVHAGRQLGARGRVTGELWLDYFTEELAAGAQINETPHPLVCR